MPGLVLVLVLALAAGCSYDESDGANLQAACVAGRSCSLDDVGACDEGLTRCPDGPDGEVECAAVAGPTSEVCDGSDNDCDGRVDEGIPDVVEGSDVGLCEPRILACRDGAFVEVQAPVGPRPEVCGDGLDQDCDGGDCSAPPEVALVSPAPGSRLVEGQTLRIEAEASDADGIDRVEFRVDGRFEGSDSTAPYRILYSVPLGARQIGIEARAVDTTGLDASTGVQLFPVDPDPGTTVTGRVIDLFDDPLAGARVRIRDAGSFDDTTAGDGSFSIGDVPTSDGAIVVEVLFGSPPRVVGASEPVDPVPGGVTDVGTFRAATVEFEDDLGNRLDLDDDDAERVSFSSGFRFPFYGETWDRVFVSSNGRLTFEFADDEEDESIFAFNLQAGIAPLFDDLDPEDGGGVFVRQDADRLVVTWDRVEERGDRRATFQVVLRSDGHIVVGYDGVDVRDGLVGITPGFSGVPDESDLSDDPPFTGAPGTMIYERFDGRSDRFDLDERFLLFAPDGAGAYEVRSTPLP